jgi:phosphoglycerol transferase MdoB-like AlkP superfamily enzyme
MLTEFYNGGLVAMGLLRPSLLLLLGWVLIFIFMRAVLVVAAWSLRSDATPQLIAGSFLRGLRFDLSIAARLSLVFVLWTIWRSMASPTEANIMLGLFGLVAGLSILAMTVEFEYYKEFQMRLGPLAFQFFDQPAHNKIIAGMIWHGFPVVRWMLFALVVTAGFVWTMSGVVTTTYLDGGWVPRLMATLIAVFLTVVLARGGLQRTPLRWGNACFSQSNFANHMAENGVFALVDTLSSMNRDRSSDKWLGKMSVEEAFEVTRAATLLPGETLVKPEKFPLLRRSPATDSPVVKRPKNVVVVIMESFSSRLCGATGAPYGATPQFDKLARQGILFDRALSVSTHTAHGVFGTLCSIPIFPGHDLIMKRPTGKQPLLTLPAVLGECGFQNVFLYNGLFSWDNKEGFFREHGVQRFVGRHDYLNPTFVDPDWGVSDHDVFQRAIAEFDKLSDGGNPFLGMVLTLSNHAPFNLPKIPGLERLTGGGDQNERINGIHYADWAIGQFMESARRCRWFDDTLFVFVGDHGFGIPPVLTSVNLMREQIPLLFYGPKVFGGHSEVRHHCAGQLDILPTILGALGVDAVHQSFGRNLLRLPVNDPGHVLIKRSGDPIVAYAEGNEIVTSAAGAPVSYHHFDLGFPPTATDDLSAAHPERAAELQRRLVATVITGLTMLAQHLAAPAAKDRLADLSAAKASG